jgi:hypothetical protein
MNQPTNELTNVRTKNERSKTTKESFNVFIIYIDKINYGLYVSFRNQKS